MKFGYTRVSKNDQSLDIQINKLTEAGCDEIFQEKKSPIKDNKLQLNLLLNKLKKGDSVCVLRLDRLGKRVGALIKLINFFEEKGIKFISLEDNIDTSMSMDITLFSICTAFSKMEQALINERIKAGLYTAQAQGRRGGRPKSLTSDKLKKLKSLIKSKEFSVTEICQMVEISRAVYYRAITTGLTK